MVNAAPQLAAPAASAYETGIIVLHYLEHHFPETAVFFTRDAQTLLKGLKRTPSGVKALPAILSDYVALTEKDMRRRSLAARDPLLHDVLALVDRHAATAPLAVPPPRAQPQQPAVSRARQTGGEVRHPAQPVQRGGAVQPSLPAAAGQRHMATSSAPPAAMRMVPTPASATVPPPAGTASLASAGRPPDMRLRRAAGTALSPLHTSRKRPPARRKWPAAEELDATGQDGGMTDALGILERSLNPETLLSLFSGGELQERFAAGLASHLSRSLPGQRGSTAPPAQQQQQQTFQVQTGSQCSPPSAAVSAYGDGTSAYLADDSVLDWSDLLTSIPEDPEMCSILEPLTMPPAPQPPAAPQPAAGEAASLQTSAQQPPALPAAPQPADATRAQHPGHAAAQPQDCEVPLRSDSGDNTPYSAAQVAALAAPATAGRPSGDFAAQAHKSATTDRQAQQPERADGQDRDDVSSLPAGKSADTTAQAPAGPDDDLMMDEQDMDTFLLELHGAGQTAG